MNDDKLPANVTSNELKKAGVKLRASNEPESRNFDLLERYRSVPNHAMFLYTSEDALIERYIREHWSALDGLSGEVCDIHVSLMQLLGEEDAYSQIEEVKSIPGLNTLDPSDLPALHIWSNSASLRIRLRSFPTEEGLRDVLRLIFSELRNTDSPLSLTRVEELGKKIATCSTAQWATQQHVANACAGRDIVQIANHFYGNEKHMAYNPSSGGESKQSIESVELSGLMKQTTDAAKAEQKIKDAKGSEVDQTVRAEKQSLSLGKYSASGKWAVIGLVVIVIIVAVSKWLAG